LTSSGVSLAWQVSQSDPTAEAGEAATRIVMTPRTTNKISDRRMGLLLFLKLL